MMNGESNVIALFGRHRGVWMERPDDWVWSTPDGQPQGFGLFWRQNVGLANLLWLALDMLRPPNTPYNWRYHELCALLVIHGAQMELDGLPLLSQVEALTVAQFRNLCETANFAAPAPVPNISKLLVLLANRRINHAHT